MKKIIYILLFLFIGFIGVGQITTNTNFTPNIAGHIDSRCVLTNLGDTTSINTFKYEGMLIYVAVPNKFYYYETYWKELASETLIDSYVNNNGYLTGVGSSNKLPVWGGAAYLTYSSGSGFVKVTNGDISYDGNTYLTTEVDGSTSNEVQTLAADSTSTTIGITSSINSSRVHFNVLKSEVDGSTSNEIQTLTYTPSTRLLDISLSATDATLPLFSTSSTDPGLVNGGSGISTKFLRGDNTWQTVATSDSDAQTLAADSTSTTIGITASGSNSRIHFNVLKAEVDGSTSNELNSSMSWTDATNTVGVVDASGTKSVVITGFLESEVDGSTSNEIEVVDETYSAANFNGGTTSGVSQDDFYDYQHTADTDDDGKVNIVDLSSAGFVKSDASGNISVDANTYLTTETDGSTSNEIQTLTYTPSTRVLDISLSATDATLPLFSTSSTDPGLVNGGSGISAKFLRGDNTWQTVATSDSDAQTLAADSTSTTIGITASGSNSRVHFNVLKAEVDGSITNEIELPTQTGQSGKYLQTNGTSPSWQTAINGVASSNVLPVGSGATSITTSSGTGFVKVTNGDISYDNSTYLSGNQSITLSGNVTGTGTTSITTTIAADAVTNAKLANMAANTMKANATASSDNPTDLALTANTFPARSSTGNIAAKSITDFGLSILDDATAADVRTTIGAGTGSGNGTVTSVASGNGMNFTTITGTGTVTMGTPTTLTASTTNATTTTSHTHAVTGFLTSEVDGSTSNELNTSSYWDSATGAVGITDAGGTKSSAIGNFSTTTTGKGFVPGSNSAGNTYFLRADATWAVPAGSSYSAGYRLGLSSTTFNNVDYWKNQDTLNVTDGLVLATSKKLSAITNNSANWNTAYGWGNHASAGYFTLPSLTPGSVLFSNGTTITQDNSNLFFDNANDRLGIGTATPAQKLDVNGRAAVDQFTYKKAIDISSQNLDSIVTAGFYNGNGLANAPNSGWFYITVQKYDGDDTWVHQVATSFGSGNTTNITYSRTRVATTWSAWKVYDTRWWKDQDTLKTTLSGLAKLTSGVVSTITDNSSNWNTAYGWGNHASAGYLTGVASSNKLAVGSGATSLTYSSGTGFVKVTAGDVSYDNSTYITTDQYWTGTSTNLVAATGRTSLGATTVGGNMFMLTNPSAITFPRFNADNTVSALSASDFRTAIGAGTGSGTVTSVSGTTPIASSGGATPAISIANAVADGSTKGAASFTAADFNATSGNVSIDYTNGQAASGSTKGFLTSTDWTTFNNKFTLPALTSGSILFSNGTTITQDNSNFFWDNTNKRLGIGITTPATSVDLYNGALKTISPTILEVYLENTGLRFKNIYGGAAGWARELMKYTNSSNTSYIGFGGYGEGQTAYYGYFGHNYDGAALKITTPNTTDAVNRVGINVATDSRPAHTLDVRGVVGIFNEGLATLDDAIYFGYKTLPTTWRNRIQSSVSSDPALSQLSFGLTTGASTYANVLFLQGDAKVGINNVAPARSLHVTGDVRVSSLDTDASAPSTSGTTKMVISDANGDLSFATIPTGTVTGTGTNTQLTKWTGTSSIGGIANGTGLLYNNGSGAYTWVAGALPALTDGKIWIGNSVNAASERTLSGDATVTDMGVVAVADNSHNHAATSITDNIISSLDGVVNDGGNIDLVPDAGIIITPDDALNKITIKNSGVLTLNGLAGDLAASTGKAYMETAKTVTSAGDTLDFETTAHISGYIETVAAQVGVQDYFKIKPNGSGYYEVTFSCNVKRTTANSQSVVFYIGQAGSIVYPTVQIDLADDERKWVSQSSIIQATAGDKIFIRCDPPSYSVEVDQFSVTIKNIR